MSHNNTEKSDGYELYKELYEFLCSKFEGDIEKTYEYVRSYNTNIDYYGDTKEKRLMNYCRFKSDVVMDKLL